MSSTPRWMMDPEFEVDGYEYYNTDDEEDINPFDEYRNDVLYDYCNDVLYDYCNDVLYDVEEDIEEGDAFSCAPTPRRSPLPGDINADDYTWFTYE